MTKKKSFDKISAGGDSSGEKLTFLMLSGFGHTLASLGVLWVIFIGLGCLIFVGLGILGNFCWFWLLWVIFVSLGFWGNFCRFGVIFVGLGCLGNFCWFGLFV